MQPTWIAEEQVVFITAKGDRIPGRIAIGKPEYVGPEEAHCPVALDGLYRHLTPAIGVTSLQALLLAARFLGTLLHGFTSQGGRVVDAADGDDIGLDSSFGPLLRDPTPRTDDDEHGDEDDDSDSR